MFQLDKRQAEAAVEQAMEIGACPRCIVTGQIDGAPVHAFGGQKAVSQANSTRRRVPKELHPQPWRPTKRLWTMPD